MHQVLTRPCFVDGRYVEYEKDAGRANVEPTNAKTNWQHVLPIPVIFASDVSPCVGAGIGNETFNPIP